MDWRGALSSRAGQIGPNWVTNLWRVCSFSFLLSYACDFMFFTWFLD